VTKQQRELLTFFGIIVVLAVILIIRFTGGGGDTVTPPGSQPVATGPATPGNQTPSPGGQGQTETDPDDLTVDQVPIEMLHPALSDSAVTARITAGSITNPFAENRRTEPVRQPSRQQSRPTRIDTVYREVPLDEWPEELSFSTLVERSDAPGVWRARINGSWYEMGDEIEGAGWKVMEVGARLIRLQKQETTRERNQVIIRTYFFRYVIPPAGSRSR
jgi:hypothetical protein